MSKGSKKKKSSNKNVTPSAKPGSRVTGLSKPTLKNNIFTAKWTLPSTASDKTRKDRWETQTVVWTFVQSFGGESKYITTTVKTDPVSAKLKQRAERDRIRDSNNKVLLARQNGSKLKQKAYEGSIRTSRSSVSAKVQKKATANFTAFNKVYNSVLYTTTSTSIVYKTNQRTVKKGQVNPKTGKKVTKDTVIYDEHKGPSTQTGQKTVKCMKLTLKTTGLTQKLNYSKYHPVVPYRYLKSVKVSVMGTNRKGNGKPLASPAYKFKPPKVPSISSVTFNSDDGGNGVLSATIDATSDAPRHRYQTKYWVEREDNITSEYKSKKVFNGQKTFKTDKHTYNVDIKNFAELDYSQWITVYFNALSQGCAGDSSKASEKSYTIAYPSLGEIKKIDVVNDTIYQWNSETKAFDKKAPDKHNGIVIVTMGFADTSHHPVDKVELYRLKTLEDKIEKVSAVPLSSWEKVKEDNGVLTALQDTIAAAYPATGQHVWYRLMTIHGPFTRLGYPMEAEALYHGPSKVTMLNARAVDDGVTPTAIELTYGFKDDEADGTQIEWSTFKNAIYSNHPPDSYDDLYVVDTDRAKELLEMYDGIGKELNYVSQFYIRDLEEGLKYYLAAARFANADSGKLLGDRTYWTDPSTKAIVPVLFGMKPQNVELQVPPSVAPLTEFSITWTFSSSFEQTAYTLFYVTDSGPDILRPRVETSEMAAQLTLDEIEKAAYHNTSNGSDEIQLRVMVETNGLQATSDNAMVTIQQYPDLQVKWPSDNAVLVKQPVTVQYKASQKSRLMISLFSEGSVGDIVPGVEYVQVDGDSVWTGAIDISPDAESFHSYGLPNGLELYDGARYTLVVYARNMDTGLESETREITFEVDWTHKAEPPSPYSTVSSDQDGKCVTIIPRRPSNFDESYPDVCDIYRVTPDGTYLVKSDVDFGRGILDRYAPYSKTANLRYVLCTKTIDGDTAYSEVGYGLKGYTIRFEWDVDPESMVPKNVLEVPYNLRIGDSYEKDFERRSYLDGSVIGYWNEAVLRTGNLQTDLIKLADPEQKELVRHMARYPGAVFVRTPDGCAYEADVQVTQFQTDYDSLVVPVAFNAQEIDLSEAFMAQSLGDLGEA